MRPDARCAETERLSGTFPEAENSESPSLDMPLDIDFGKVTAGIVVFLSPRWAAGSESFST